MSGREQETQELAYRLWEEAGRPEGHGDRYWHEAQRLLAEKGTAGAKKAKAPGKTKAALKDTPPARRAVVKGEGDSAVATPAKAAAPKAAKKAAPPAKKTSSVEAQPKTADAPEAKAKTPPAKTPQVKTPPAKTTSQPAKAAKPSPNASKLRAKTKA